MPTQHTEAMVPAEKWLSTVAGARYCAMHGLRVMRGTLRIHGLTGRIKARRWGRYIQLDRAALDRFIADALRARSTSRSQPAA